MPIGTAHIAMMSVMTIEDKELLDSMEKTLAQHNESKEDEVGRLTEPTLLLLQDKMQQLVQKMEEINDINKS